MRRFLKWALPVVVLASAGAAGWFLWLAPGNSGPPLPTQRVAIGDVEDNVSALGSLQPLEYVDVGTQVSGQLQRLVVEVGADVKRGDLLAEIDPTVYQARVNASEAQLLNLSAQKSEREAFRRLVQQQVGRQKELLAVRATSQDAYEVASAQLQQVTAQIAALDAQIRQTQSTLTGDQANLRYTRIFAPMDGTVVSITAKRGQTLNANQTAPIILRIADLDTMTVWTQVSEADVPKLKLGMSVYFTTLGRPDRRWTGKLRQVMPTPEVVNNVILYNALFDVENADRTLMPQMSAQAFFIIAEARRVPIVPMTALRRVRGPGGRYVVRVMENGQPVERPVQVGVTNRLLAEVKSGLKEGEEVVVDQAPGGQRPQQRPGGPSGPRTPRL
ncbi:MAG: efflux RND transporter periplasmic adaptor subunit [Rhodospirillales bacterium]